MTEPTELDETPAVDPAQPQDTPAETEASTDAPAEEPAPEVAPDAPEPDATVATEPEPTDPAAPDEPIEGYSEYQRPITYHDVPNANALRGVPAGPPPHPRTRG